MTEFELVYVFDLINEDMLQQTQWWAGMSFGLIGLAHFGQKRLNLLIVVLLLIIYVAFSMNTVVNFLSSAARLTENIADLATLPADEISESTKLIIEQGQEGLHTWQVLSYSITFFGPFFGAIGYLLYCYRRQRANRRASAQASNN